MLRSKSHHVPRLLPLPLLNPRVSKHHLQDRTWPGERPPSESHWCSGPRNSDFQLPLSPAASANSLPSAYDYGRVVAVVFPLRYRIDTIPSRKPNRSTFPLLSVSLCVSCCFCYLSGCPSAGHIFRSGLTQWTEAKPCFAGISYVDHDVTPLSQIIFMFSFSLLFPRTARRVEPCWREP